MSTMPSCVRPDRFLFLRLPNETLKLIEVKLNTIIDVGKLGSFPSNLLIGRPYYHTYELLEKRGGELHSRLRIVSPTELHAETALEDATTPADPVSDSATPSATNRLPQSYDLLADTDGVLLKNNRLTIDDASRQQLSQAQIEELKKTAGGKEVIEKILANHAGLDEKTAFAKAKYMVRKHKKYLKRFTVLPVDLGNVIDYVMDKEAPRIMEMREETLGLIGAWSNAHVFGADHVDLTTEGRRVGGGRWLAVDEAGGLIVAGLAERMNILYPPAKDESTKPILDIHAGAVENNSNGNIMGEIKTNGDGIRSRPTHRDFPTPAATNTVTLIHPAVQPNLSLLKYFGYDTSNLALPAEEDEHPLHTHLKTLSWLQLLHPEEDPTYKEPEQFPEEILAGWKSGKRGTYFKKRRRWERCKMVVDETREGGFEGLVIATHMNPVTVLAHTVPLVRGGGQVVMYAPTIETLVNVMDLYSKERRAAYIAHISKGEVPDPEDFPVDPRLLLAPTVQTSRAREWQVLPGRTHPMMTSKGGAEGYVLTASKVIPLDGGVEARGNFNNFKRRKMAPVCDAPVVSGIDLAVSDESAAEAGM